MSNRPWTASSSFGARLTELIGAIALAKTIAKRTPELLWPGRIGPIKIPNLKAFLPNVSPQAIYDGGT
jgi:hypothetical protein